MLTTRSVLLSARALAQQRLESSLYGLRHGFNVYDEEDMRNEVAVVQPALFLVTAHIVPAQVTLPFIALEVTDVRPYLLEMGSTAGRTREIRFHVYGKNLAQRDDLAEYLANPDVILRVPIHDYDGHYDDPALLETGKIDYSQTLNVRPTIEPEAYFEGSWRYRRIVRLVLVTVQ